MRNIKKLYSHDKEAKKALGFIFTLFEKVLAFNQIRCIVRIMKNAKLNQISIRTLNALNKIELSFENGEIARDLEHAAFIAKSDYIENQMAKAEFMKFRGYLIAVINGRALVETMFEKVEGGYQTKRIDPKTYSEMERAA